MKVGVVGFLVTVRFHFDIKKSQQYLLYCAFFFIVCLFLLSLIRCTNFIIFIYFPINTKINVTC